MKNKKTKMINKSHVKPKVRSKSQVKAKSKKQKIEMKSER
jgi:hypothetical protein